MISGWVLWRLYLCSPSADHRHSCYYAQTEVDFYLLQYKCICVFVYYLCICVLLLLIRGVVVFILCVAFGTKRNTSDMYHSTNVSHARVIPDDDQLEELRLANTTNVYNTSAQSVENYPMI